MLQDLEGWTRHRQRCVLWKQWKRSPVRFAELMKRGVSRELATRTVGSGHGPWRLGNSPALSQALPNTFFDSLGLPRLAIRRYLNPPNRRMRTRTYDGVGGEEP